MRALCAPADVLAPSHGGKSEANSTMRSEFLHTGAPPPQHCSARGGKVLHTQACTHA